VEPGEPAYDEIVEYFGKQVLQEDGTLDRKALSAVVFADLEKRKKLEGFTHPRIYQEFFRQIEEIAAREARPVIVADVPLLIELNLGYLFDKIIVVAISPEEQTARLRERDGISEEEARAMLKAQLPIGEKAGFADFVIHNGGTVEETRAQVEKVWAKLQGLREQL
jgi:dephospho-CoA kinase